MTLFSKSDGNEKCQKPKRSFLSQIYKKSKTSQIQDFQHVVCLCEPLGNTSHCYGPLVQKSGGRTFCAPHHSILPSKVGLERPGFQVQGLGLDKRPITGNCKVQRGAAAAAVAAITAACSCAYPILQMYAKALSRISNLKLHFLPQRPALAATPMPRSGCICVPLSKAVLRAGTCLKATPLRWFV